MKLVFLSDVKTFLEKTDTVHDDLLSLIIEFVSSQVQTFLNRTLKKQQITEKFNGGRRYYDISAYPIDLAQTITVTVDGTTKIKDTDYWVWEKTGTFEFQTEPPTTKPRNVVITATGGYSEILDTISVPDDIKLATLIQTVYLFRNRDKLGIATLKTPDGGMSLVPVSVCLQKGVQDMLRPYRKTPGMY